MTNYRYILQPYKGINTRFRCPQCKKNHVFALYVGKETNEPLSEIVGRCNREGKCAYHYSPKQYFQDNNIFFDANSKNETYKFQNKNTVIEQKTTSYISSELFLKSLKQYEYNHFITYLIKLFGVETVQKLIENYFIGTSKCFNGGAVVFWQIDSTGKIRTGKIMLYNPVTGRRSGKINWVHSVTKQPNFELKQCLFGEHLLKDELTKTVAIVESEKTAIIASVYLPQFIWLACGSKTGINMDKCKILKGREVILFPDMGCFEFWSNKRKELSAFTKCSISDLLEKQALKIGSDEGLDLADFLSTLDYKTFFQPKIQAIPLKAEIIDKGKPSMQETTLEYESSLEKIKQSWNDEISELESFFENNILSETPVYLNSFTKITNISKFIKNHLRTIKANNGNKTYFPYLDRLQQLKILTHLDNEMPF